MSVSSGFDFIGILVGILFWGIILAPPILLGYFAFRFFRRGRRVWGAVFSTALALYLGMIVFIGFLILPGGDLIIARTTTPDGTELCVVQIYDDFYTTAFFAKHPGENWGQYYFFFEALRWLSGSIELDADGIAQIRRNGSVVATFDPATDTLAITDSDRKPQEEPFEMMPDGWTPETWREE